jgi:hypothetical protein
MLISTRTFLVLATLLGAVSSTVAQSTTVNDKIVKFCKDHVGQKVGDGECSDLGDEALKSAGAKPRSAFKDFPNEEDLVWGELVYALEIKDNAPKETKVPKTSIQPGDVIQLRDARFAGKNLRGVENYEAEYGHHSAVVVAVKKETGVLTILEQNFNGKKMVTESTYRLSDLKAGWVRVYRPVAE